MLHADSFFGATQLLSACNIHIVARLTAKIKCQDNVISKRYANMISEHVSRPVHRAIGTVTQAVVPEILS